MKHAERKTDAFDLEFIQTPSWVHSGSAMILVDSKAGLLIDANPAAELLTGYRREELVGLNRNMLHPEDEQGRLGDIYCSGDHHQAQASGAHILRKDGSHLPICISPLGTIGPNSQSLTLYRLEQMSHDLREHRYLNQNWALAAYAAAAVGCAQESTPSEQLQAVCDAIARQSIYALAWIAVAEDGLPDSFRTAAAAGSALGDLDALQSSWSEEEREGHGPLGISLRTRTSQVMNDSEAFALFKPWRARAREAGIRSAITVPIQVEGSWQGALVVYSHRIQAFDAVSVSVFENLAALIRRSVKDLGDDRPVNTETERLESTETRLTEALTAISVAMAAMNEMYGAGPDGAPAPRSEGQNVFSIERNRAKA